MRFGGFLGFMLFLLVALFAGGVGYAIGINSAVTTTAATGGVSTVVVAHAPWFGWGFWGFPFFGLFFAFLFFAIIFGIVRHAIGGRDHAYRHGWYGYGPNGPSSPSGPGPVPPPVDDMLKDWHRQAHESGTPDQGMPPRS
jgi:hypothetical protein